MTTAKTNCMTCVTILQTTGVLVSAPCTKDTNINNLYFPNIIILEDEEYEKWAKDTLTEMDREVTRELIGEPVKKKICLNCNRPETQNKCACGKWSIYCYSCHLNTDHEFTPDSSN